MQRLHGAGGILGEHGRRHGDVGHLLAGGQHRDTRLAQDREQLGQGLRDRRCPGPDRRDEVLREIAAYIRTAGAGPLGRQLFLALATRMAVREDLALRYLGP